MRLAPPRPQRVIRVRCILAGTAAARTQSPVISVGDELVRVNDVDVTSSALLDVNAAIMGVPGTSVSLTLRRSLSQAARAQADDTDDSEASSDIERDLDLWSYFNVRLVRGSAEYLALVDTAQALLQERNALSEQLEAARDEKDAQLKRVMALREQLHVSEEQIQREQLLASQLYYAKRTGAAVTAGELAFGARIKELEKELESKSSEARSLERQVSCLSARHIDTNNLKERPPRRPGFGAEAWDSRNHAWNMWEPDTLNPSSDSDNVPRVTPGQRTLRDSGTAARIHLSGTGRTGPSCGSCVCAADAPRTRAATDPATFSISRLARAVPRASCVSALGVCIQR